MGIPTAYVTYLIGMIVGAIIVSFIENLKKTHGTLKIDRHDPDKDLYRIELDDLDEVASKKKLVLKIDAEADLSQK